MKRGVNSSLMKEILKQLLCLPTAPGSKELVENMSPSNRRNRSFFETASKDPVRAAFLLMNQRGPSQHLTFIHSPLFTEVSLRLG